MHHNKKTVVLTLIATVLAMNVFFAGLLAYALSAAKERKEGETKTFPGVLSDHGVTRADAEQMVLAARLKAGWINEDDLAAEEAEEAEDAGA